MSKRLDGIIGCKYKTSSWHLNEFPDDGVVTLVQQSYAGEKLTVMLHTYTNRYAGTPDKTKQNILMHN